MSRSDAGARREAGTAELCDLCVQSGRRIAGSMRARSSCSAAAPSRSTASVDRSRDVPAHAVACVTRSAAPHGTPSGGRRAFTSRCSCTAWRVSPRVCTCWSARTRRCRGSRPHSAASSSGNPWPMASRCGGCRRATTGQLSQRLSCDQEIAADGFFSLGMIADFDAALEMHGPSFYRQLFWESGVVGQVLYLEAEAAGARATGIGCLLRRSGASTARPFRPRVSEPVPLHRRDAGRGCAADHRTRVSMGRRKEELAPQSWPRLAQMLHSSRIATRWTWQEVSRRMPTRAGVCRRSRARVLVSALASAQFLHGWTRPRQLGSHCSGRRRATGPFRLVVQHETGSITEHFDTVASALLRQGELEALLIAARGALPFDPNPKSFGPASPATCERALRRSS